MSITFFVRLNVSLASFEATSQIYHFDVFKSMIFYNFFKSYYFGSASQKSDFTIIAYRYFIRKIFFILLSISALPIYKLLENLTFDYNNNLSCPYTSNLKISLRRVTFLLKLYNFLMNKKMREMKSPSYLY